ncbi:MAG: mannitol dehydrogenase family protein, partial [Burkholderiales bacterium]|nr:mannitol dehydrogenase family protein [Burkholderiales bacterium]
MNQILHLGLGSFHRAHQAVYLQRLIERGETDWTLVGGNIRADMAETLAALAAQNGEYTLETVAPDGQSRFERIRSISRVVPYDDQLAGLIALGAAPETKIISFTVTEAGYYLDAAHHLDPSYAEIQGDIAGRTRCTIYGALAAILAARRERGSGPVTLLNCDNLRSNGERVHTGLTEFIALRGERELGAWVEANTTCPNAMVDRITPRPAADLPARVKAETGWDDRAPVM